MIRKVVCQIVGKGVSVKFCPIAPRFSIEWGSQIVEPAGEYSINRQNISINSRLFHEWDIQYRKSVAYHEAFHHVWHTALNLVQREILEIKFPAIPCDTGIVDSTEHQALQFESYAFLRDDGEHPCFRDKSPVNNDVEQIFANIYEGRFAREKDFTVFKFPIRSSR